MPLVPYFSFKLCITINGVFSVICAYVCHSAVEHRKLTSSEMLLVTRYCTYEATS
jgi:hypothetical protein